MLNEKELLYLLALQRAKGIGEITAKKLLSHTGSAEALFNEKKSKLLHINGIGTQLIENLKDIQLLENAEKEINHIQKFNIKYYLYADSDYPENLKQCIDSPLVLFYDGKTDWKNRKTLSIVGTRNMTPYGRSFIEQLITELKPFQPIIVSGFAYGVDITAHKTAMSNGLTTVAVLAHGLNNIYPKTHAKYMSVMMENGGFITEFWHDEPPLRENFLQRNRIIAGISEATIVIESAVKGGALVTAEMANSYNREVFAVPGRVNDVYSGGCNNLIRTNKAQLLHSVDDLIYYLNWDQNNKQDKKIQPQLFVELLGDDKTVYEHLQQKGKTDMDTLSINTRIPIYKLSSVLLHLELQGLIRPLPGKLFELV